MWGDVMRFLEVKGKEVVYKGNSIGFVDNALVNFDKKVISSFLIKPSYDKGVYFIKINDFFIEKEKFFVKRFFKVKNNIYKQAEKFLLTSVLGKSVYENNLKDIGSVVDVIFDENTGIIKAIIISLGIFDDLVNGRKIHMLNKDDVLNSDKIIVKEDSVEIINEISIV